MTNSNKDKILPLEEYLKSKWESDPHGFPERNTNYYEQYCSIKSWVTKNYFRNAGGGLSRGDGQRYTHHDLGHVEDVIETAGNFLRVKDGLGLLSGFETYLLLVSILLHDAGNAQGRDGHETKTTSILFDMKDVAGMSTQEKKLAGKIAKAHGGKYQKDGVVSKDTITNIIDSIEETFPNSVKVRPRLLAAVLRLSDEFAEKTDRANYTALLDLSDVNNSVYNEDVLHNLYSHVITIDCCPESYEIRLVFNIDVNDLNKKFKYTKKIDSEDRELEVFFTDYITDRLIKSDSERRYCNRFLMGLIYIDVINVVIEINDNLETLETIKLRIEERQYPEPLKRLHDQDEINRLDGITLSSRYSRQESSGKKESFKKEKV
ncbi:MAG: hypothetical protein OEZ47_07345 [Gammaproteobacteria bacterium]|nr:hypothetical protein [Gammaproteobacteria bacterium]